MIAALILVAAIRLTPAEFDLAVEKTPEVVFYNSLADIRRRYDEGMLKLGAVPIREDACDRQKSALQLAQSLQRDVDFRVIQINDPALQAKAGGAKYTLNDDEVRKLVSRIHELEYEERTAAVDCGA